MAETYNRDVDTVHGTICRVIDEMSHSASSGVNMILEKDYLRCKSFIKAIREDLNHYAAKPVLDINEQHPSSITMRQRMEIPKMENETYRHCISMFEILGIEMESCQSGRLASSIIEFDLERWLDILVKMESFLDYAKDRKLDFPESSPRTSSTGKGKTGLNPGDQP